MIVCVPEPTSVGVYITEHLPVPSSVHVALLNVPTPLLIHVTVPVGVFFVPGPVSLTVAVQVVVWSTTTLPGVQATDVAVERFAADTVVEPLLTLCFASPLYVAVIVALPAVPGTYVAEHAAASVPVAASMQVARTKTPEGSELVNVTVPEGGDRVPTSVSCTVAVQIAGTPMTSAPQPTVVAVVRFVPVTVVVPLLGRCFPPPP